MTLRLHFTFESVKGVIINLSIATHSVSVSLLPRVQHLLDYAHYPVSRLGIFYLSFYWLHFFLIRIFILFWILGLELSHTTWNTNGYSTLNIIIIIRILVTSKMYRQTPSVWQTRTTVAPLTSFLCILVVICQFQIPVIAYQLSQYW